MLCVTLGCPAPPAIDLPKVYPPLFSNGDSVRVIESPGNECGYIISTTHKNNCWNYTIMFQTQNMYYDEKDIVLVKRAVWHDENKPLPLAETENEKYFNVLKEAK